MREILRTQLRAFSVRFRKVGSDRIYEYIPKLVDGFEKGITKRTSFERHNRGREDNIKWEFEKQVVNVLFGSVSVRPIAWLFLMTAEKLGCLDPLSTCRLLKEL
jgi:hypothetical protein